MKKAFIVRALWDEEAQVWCAEGVNFGGLATYARTQEDLIEKLKVMIPELLQASHEVDSGDYPTYRKSG